MRVMETQKSASGEDAGKADTRYDVRTEVQDGLLQLASGKRVPAMITCGACGGKGSAEQLNLPIVKGLVGDKTVDVLRNTGCEGVVVRRGLVDDDQLRGKYCLIVRIDNTVLLAEKARIQVKTPYLSGEVEALCISEVICDLIVGNVPGARNSDDPDMTAMVGAVTTRALTFDVPVRQTPYAVPFALKSSLKKELQQMEDLGIIRKSDSPYASPVVVVKKKDGSNRICIDSRRLNKITVTSSFANRVFPWYERGQVLLQARLDQGLSPDTCEAFRCPQDCFRDDGSTL